MHETSFKMVTFVSSTAFFLRIAATAAPDKYAAHLDPLTQTAFRGDENPLGSNQNPRHNQAILFVVVQPASSHSLQHKKFAWEVVPEAFC